MTLLHQPGGEWGRSLGNVRGKVFSLPFTLFTLSGVKTSKEYIYKEVLHSILTRKGGELIMRKVFVVALVVVVMFMMAVSAFAVPAGKTVEFDGKGAGKVVFDGKIHADKGLKCADCHQSGLFKMKKGAEVITMKAINDGKFCGGCHNGAKAFSAKDAASCAKCHKK
jgi:c(7)-type cytochrome triheme protein